jgi:hypothetical protein
VRSSNNRDFRRFAFIAFLLIKLKENRISWAMNLPRNHANGSLVLPANDTKLVEQDRLAQVEVEEIVSKRHEQCEWHR